MKHFLAVAIAILTLYGCGEAPEVDRRPAPAQQQQQADTQSQLPTTPLDQMTSSGNPSNSNCNHNFNTSTTGPINTSGQAAVPLLGSVNFQLKAQAQVSVSGQDSQGTIALNAQIESFSPALARSLADNIVSSYRDPLVLTYATGQERDAIFSQPTWKGLECIVLPVKAIRNSSYEYQYDPPIPFLVNSNVSVQDLSAIGSRQFPGINARIARHPTASAGSHQGTASLTASGNNLTITFDFGGVAPKANATPVKSVVYTLDGNGGYSSTNLSVFVSDNSLIELKVGN